MSVQRAFTIQSTSAELSRSTVSVANCTAVEVKNVGKPVSVGDTPHQKSNHLIVQSRPYFPNAKLCTYVCAYSKLNRYSVRCLLASFFGALSAADSINRIPALIFLVLDLVWVAIFIQHEWVNRTSLPVVRKQEVIPGQRHLNAFYTVTVTQLTGATLENHRANIGVVKLAQGEIQFQAFNPQAVEYMERARWMSRVMLFLYLCLLVYNVYFSAA